ncbi:MAG TPA: hypothetical protein VJL08_00720, partial [Dehalococcoidia bacterium]|nr:hypothetical protein [Dehalococcoidia bacterium]
NVQVASEQKTIIDSTGKFEFKGLSVDPANAYQVKTRFQEADYVSEKATLKADNPSQNIELTVYDSTSGDETIQASNGHMVVYIDQGNLDVLEVWRFSNTGTKTYIGTQGKTGRVTLRFTLPAGATAVSPGEGFAPETIDTGIADTMAVPPGLTDISFSYVVPYVGSSVTLSRKADYAIANFGLLVQDAGGTVKSVALAKSDPLDMGGAKFQYFTAKNLSRGADIDASITGLGASSGSANSALPSQGFPWPWLLVGVLALALLATLAYPQLKKRQALAQSAAGRALPQGATQEPSEEKALLRQMAQLDDEYEAGKIKEPDYQLRRFETKARLMEIYARGKGSGK